MKIKARLTRLAFTAEEKRKHYEQIKGSARVFENRKKYKRSRDKGVKE